MFKSIIRPFILSLICICFLLQTPIISFAANVEESINTSEITYLSNSQTITLHHTHAQASKIMYFGYNPTVQVTASGNPNMIFKVWVYNPLGIKGDIGYVRGDGSTIRKNLFLSVSGPYHVYVQPWSGTTNGNNVNFYFSW